MPSPPKLLGGMALSTRNLTEQPTGQLTFAHGRGSVLQRLKDVVAASLRKPR
jgi:hypothetical protein